MQNGCWKIVDIETMLTIDENHDLNDSISDIQAGPSMMCFFFYAIAAYVYYLADIGLVLD